MRLYPIFKPFFLAMLFIKEQLKEPVALLWIVISPAITFYLIMYTKVSSDQLSSDYLSGTSWFYAFIASSVALFGLAFYIVGRRESGFLRSFVYVKRTKIIFLTGQLLAHSFMSVIYCSVFYVLTRSHFGLMSLTEWVVIVGRFYICFLLFSTPSLLLTLIPIGFQNTSTVFSIFSFAMLALGIGSLNSSHPLVETIAIFNPMGWANRIMLVGVAESLPMVTVVVGLFIFTGVLVFRFLLINPVWSRY
ncbi:ABC transporter permease [Pseudomonas sp. ICBG1301]|uniref:ABC transporter permease n=1 Tax=Pseudomonas sp. ICBG1301 TaxID=2795987 RepID=UPI0019666C7A|nr:ABC transporter permease [Pseudomonas sp. ICBG1301]MBM9484930.1 ABC transporter permease [Pseudomonas sp. ICBG1301]